MYNHHFYHILKYLSTTLKSNESAIHSILQYIIHAHHNRYTSITNLMLGVYHPNNLLPSMLKSLYQNINLACRLSLS